MNGLSATSEEDTGDGAGDGSSSSSKSKKTPGIFMEDLTSQVRHLVKEGKITIHSAMAIWVGSPYGAAEAFKISQNSPSWSLEDEIETKFSAAILDMIDILLNLQHEDPFAFWHGGLKDAALETLVPLAAQVVQLRRKLRRMTATLERQAGELGQVLADLERPRETWTKCTSSVQNKSSHCHKIRQAMRQAWFSFSSRNEKKLPGSKSRNQNSEESPESCQNCCEETLTKNSTEGHMNSGAAVGLVRNKSECLGGRGHLCSGHIGGGSQENPPRPRLVPSHLFVQQQQQQADICMGNATEEQNGSCDNGRQVKVEVNQEVKVEEEGPRGDSGGFKLESPRENATSYLRDYENCRLKIDVETDASLKRSDATLKKSDAILKRSIATLRKSDATLKKSDATLKQSDATMILSDSDGNFLEKTDKEVVVIRSAVSNFAESEFGVIDTEDLEWLRGIEARGETGHICADEIEQSERLKRQSIFMHCFRYRAEEILKDIHIVSQALRNVERKWVDPSSSSDAGAGSDRDLNGFQLDELIKLLAQLGNSFTRRLYEDQDEKYERLVAIKLVKMAHEDVTACCRSFTRFLKMVTADTYFLRHLSTGFPDRSREQREADQEVGDIKKPSNIHQVSRACPIKDLGEIFSPSSTSVLFT